MQSRRHVKIGRLGAFIDRDLSYKQGAALGLLFLSTCSCSSICRNVFRRLLDILLTRLGGVFLLMRLLSSRMSEAYSYLWDGTHVMLVIAVLDR